MIKRIILIILVTCNVVNAGSIQEMQRAVVNHSTETPASYLVFWDCDSATNTDGGTVTQTGVTHPPGIVGNGVEIDSDTDVVYMPAIDPDQINATKGYIKFWYRTTGTPHAFGRFFNHCIAVNNEASLDLFRNDSDNQIRLEIGGVGNTFDVTGEAIFGGTGHWIEVRWDQSTGDRSIYVDDTLVETDTAAFTAPTLTSGNIAIGQRDGQPGADGGFNIGGILDSWESGEW